jgi:ribosomal protein S12 methylthiotransferase
MMIRRARVGFISLGCPKNLVDTEVMMGILREEGFEIVPDGEADIVIVNTCAFIGPAEEESKEAISEISRLRRSGRKKGLVVVGCFAQKYGEKVVEAFPEVDAVLGTGELTRISDIVMALSDGGTCGKEVLVGEPRYLYDHRTPRERATLPHTAYVKIGEGCDHRCTFCIIPSLRGRGRERSIESICEEVRIMAREGVVEIDLISQDTTSYGIRTYGRPMLHELLKELSEIDGIRWIRVLYSYPTKVYDELLETIASEEKVCKYLDIPMQHVSDRILKAMGRVGRRADLERVLKRARDVIPNLVVRTTFIVGFPGEEDGDFEELLSFIEESRIDRVGIFKFSPQPGTRAASMPNQIPEEVKEERFAVAMELQRRISKEKNEGLVGSTIDVLIDRRLKRGLYVGRSMGHAPDVDGVIYVKGEGARPGDIVEVMISSASDYDLMGRIADSAREKPGVVTGAIY